MSGFWPTHSWREVTGNKVVFQGGLFTECQQLGPAVSHSGLGLRALVAPCHSSLCKILRYLNTGSKFSLFVLVIMDNCTANIERGPWLTVSVFAAGQVRFCFVKFFLVRNVVGF